MLKREVNCTNCRKFLNLVALFILLPTSILAQHATGILSGHLWDKDSSRVTDSVIILAKKDQATYRTVSDTKGNFSFGELPFGTYKINIQSILFKTQEVNIHLHKDQNLELIVEKIQRTLAEVYVTANESKGMTSSSIIDRKAMQHLQPSSFTDLLELLPGGRAKDPKLTSMNQIRLREVSDAPASNYDISSLGTAFLIDGSPINTSANLQSAAAYFASDPNSSRNSVNKGVDMRTLSTDQIEKVEIIRGIPSVEYGDLTSGLIKIERIKGATPINARMKTDGFSKLFAVGKGFDLPTQQLTINADLGYLTSKADPTSSFENYKRINGSLRLEKHWVNSRYLLKWNTAIDYSSNIDNKRTDPDNSYALTDKYKSTYQSYGLATGIKSEITKPNSLLKSWEVSGKLNYQHDKIDVIQWTQARTATVLLNSLQAGEHDIQYLTPSYAAEFTADGKPITAFLKAMTQLMFYTSELQHQLKLGTETNYSKNLGKGQIYDINYPSNINAVSSARPRAFDTIPGMLNQSAFAEDMVTFSIGRHSFATSVGIRAMMLAGMSNKYSIANKVYFDPRINTKWTLPKVFVNNKPLSITLGGGYGLHTKMPTTDQLHPNAQYIDIVQLNFFHNNPAFRKANAVTYINDRTNYDLQAAINKKFELNADFALNQNRLTITWFREKLTSGFRTTNQYNAYSYKKYNPASVDAANLETPPLTSDFTYELLSRYYNTSTFTNGSTLIKNGIEFQFSSRRVPVVNTRFTLNGAYLRNTYINTFPFYKINQEITVNKNVAQYVALYNDTDGSFKEQFNTNITTDSYLPKLGLTLSASIQSMWFTASQNAWKSGTPVQYTDIDGKTHPFTEESKNDPNVNYFNEIYNESLFRRNRVPIDLQVNIKASKDFKKKATISMFVNRLVTYTPDYTAYGILRKRSGFNSPYFGMELNFNF
ncbi:TonB-dependent receptor [Chitinophaga silvatica]|uniref:TonB-dependent receptor n=1 Tax=Chitinophaga silvatica TaxID=2282649 RepID=UPI001314EE02|nr:TonB-dependent receptor plug domain-containing protein [Chitinophaga silvatica]